MQIGNGIGIFGIWISCGLMAIFAPASLMMLLIIALIATIIASVA